jgi:hypothetical protein
MIKMKSKTRPARRHPIFADLMTPKYRKRIVPSKKIYSRKRVKKEI